MSTSRGYWSLNKLMVLLLAGGYLMLLLEIRFDHNDVITETWKAWIPIVFCPLAVILALAGLSWWEKGGRQVLLVAFAISFIVGGLGFYFHNQRKMVPRVVAMVSLMAQAPHREPRPQPVPSGAPNAPSARVNRPVLSRNGPPVLAPLSFMGLGLFGILACARRFQA